MQPSRLDNTALKFELAIRNAEFKEEELCFNQRTLRSLIREEIADSSRRPKPKLKPDDQVIDIVGYFNNLVEKTTVSGFKRGDKDYEDVYAQLCHVEGRMVYIDWEQQSTDGTRSLYEGLEKNIGEFRQKWYANKQPYVIKKPRDALEEGEEFSEQKQKEMDELEAKLKEMKIQRAYATQKNISYAIELNESVSDDEREKVEEELAQKEQQRQKDNERQQQRQEEQIKEKEKELEELREVRKSFLEDQQRVVDEGK
jgi:hypothetical protein